MMRRTTELMVRQMAVLKGDGTEGATNDGTVDTDS